MRGFLFGVWRWWEVEEGASPSLKRETSGTRILPREEPVQLCAGAGALAAAELAAFTLL